MKILALLGSPRPNGNTRAVLDHVLEGAERAGAEVELVDLSKLEDITGCCECYVCQQSPDEPGCAVDDDMQEILSKALTADLLILATPVFCWSMSWLLKMAVDRMYCMFKFGGEDVRSLLEGRRMAGVITAAGEENDGANKVTETFTQLAKFSKCKWLGSFVAARVETQEAIRADRDLCTRAAEFGRELVQKA